MKTRPSWNEQRFENLLTHGIASVKAGEREAARNFLAAAARLNTVDARPWLWLAAVAPDVGERRNCLEEALARDPANQQARRGLVALAGGEPLRPIGAPVQQPIPTMPVPAQGQSFSCPNCGGRMAFGTEGGLRCERCGSTRAIMPESHASGRREQPLDFTLPTARGQRWAAVAHTFRCSQCGATEVLPAEAHTTICAFCGSDHLLASPETDALIAPQALVPMGVDEAAARRAVAGWLKQGWLTPRDLRQKAARLTLRPAYYPVWSFDATFHARWWAMVEVREDQWERREGEKTLFFDNVMVPGLRQLPTAALASVAPFDLRAAVAFQPELLAGWTAFLPDQSLADASIAARGIMAARARARLEDTVLIDKRKRDLTVIPQNPSDQTFRALLLPLWVGHYYYQGQRWTLWVNGQTGEVSGAKPRRAMRVALLAVVGLLLVVTALVAAWVRSTT